jgi:hypothetical protein
MLPMYAQCRKSVWDAVNPKSGLRRIDEAFPIAIREKTRENDMFIQFKNGASWQLVGSDNFNALVGSPPIGIVASEWALADPLCWPYIMPILEENNGFALFITTSRGNNHAKTMLDHAMGDEKWFAEVTKADRTPVFTSDQLENIRKELVAIWGDDLGEALFNQEYMCFPAGTKIWTANGQRDIEKININDVVLTHAGRWRKVTKTHQQEHSNPLALIKSAGSCVPLRLTANHPVRLCDPATQTYRWSPAGDVKLGDYVVLPRVKRPSHSIIDNELAELIAWFISEGSVAKNLVSFSLNKKETDVASRTARHLLMKAKHR